MERLSAKSCIVSAPKRWHAPLESAGFSIGSPAVLLIDPDRSMSLNGESCRIYRKELLDDDGISLSSLGHPFVSFWGFDLTNKKGTSSKPKEAFGTGAMPWLPVDLLSRLGEEVHPSDPAVKAVIEEIDNNPDSAIGIVFAGFPATPVLHWWIFGGKRVEGILVRFGPEEMRVLTRPDICQWLGYPASPESEAVCLEIPSVDSIHRMIRWIKEEV